MIAAALVLSLWAAAEPPARPSEADLAFKTAMIGFLERKGARNPAAAETAAFLKANPVDVRIASLTDVSAWYGLDGRHLRAFVSPKSDTLVVLHKPDDGVNLLGPDRSLVSGERLGTALELLGSVIVHEVTHVQVNRGVRWPSMGVIQNELLAHVNEARYLEKELVLDEDMKEVARRYRRFLRLKADGVRPGAPQWASAEEDVNESIRRMGTLPVTLAALLVAYREGPRAMAEHVRHLYASKNLWSVYGDPGRRIQKLDALLADLPGGDGREALTIQRGFWSDPKKVAAARRYFDRALPDYRSLSWRRME